MESASSRPTNFGSNSPKKRRMIVEIIKISASSKPKDEMRNTENKEAKAILTMLLDISSVEKKRSGFFMK
jgi:hypothetical protein